MNTAFPATKVKRVVAGILVRGDEILCCQRSASDAWPLKWEFPGGKIEPGESPEDALRRELREELAIHAEIGALVADLRHSYEPAHAIELSFFAVRRWRGEIVNLIFNEVRWIKRAHLTSLDFLAADLELVRQIAVGEVQLGPS